MKIGENVFAVFDDLALKCVSDERRKKDGM